VPLTLVHFGIRVNDADGKGDNGKSRHHTYPRENGSARDTCSLGGFISPSEEFGKTTDILRVYDKRKTYYEHYYRRRFTT